MPHKVGPVEAFFVVVLIAAFLAFAGLALVGARRLLAAMSEREN